MQRIFTTATAATLFMATSATAEGLTFGYVNADYTDLQFESGDRSYLLLEGAAEYELRQFLLSADIQYLRIDRGSVIEFTDYEIGAGYFITPEILVGAGLTRTATDASGGIIVIGPDRTNGYELYGQFRDDTFGVALSYEQLNNDDDSYFAAINSYFAAIMGQYAVNETTTVGARIEQRARRDSIFLDDDDFFTYQLNAEYADGPYDLRGHYSTDSDFEFGTLGAVGTYNFTDDIRGSASYQTSVGSNSGDSSFYLIGAGYRIAEQVWVDGFYGRTAGEDTSDIERLTLSVSFDTGKRQRLDQVFEQDLFDDEQRGRRLFD